MELGQKLKENPEYGTSIGQCCFKIRIAIAIVVKKGAVYLLSIYDKSEKDNLSDKELAELLTYIPY